MSDDQFTKLFKYIQDFRKEVDGSFDDVSKRFNETQSQIDGLAGLIRDYQQEMLMLAHKIDRLEQWIHKIAEATGVKLNS